LKKVITSKLFEEIYHKFLFSSIIILGFFSKFPALDKPLNEFFAFRQTQTAWGAKGLLLFGPSEFVTQTPVFGPPFKVPFEFPVYQWMHFVVVKLTNFNVDYSGRLLSLIIFQLVAIQIYFLVKKIINKKIAFYSLILFELTPFGFQWSTAILIDYMSILFILTGINCILRINSTKRVIYVAGSFFVLASLVKITTFIICLPLILYIVNYRKNQLKKPYLVYIGLMIIPILIGQLWTSFADSIKRANPETDWLTSDNLIRWNFGTVAERFDPNIWVKIFNILDSLSLGFKGSFLLIFAILVYLNQKEEFRKSTSSFLLTLVISTFFGPLIFINLYFVHDYYFIPISVFMAIVIPGVLNEIFEGGPIKFENWSRTIILLIIIFLMWLSPLGVSYYNNLKTGVTIPETSNIVKKYTTKEDLVVVVNCNNWDPTILYYADRRGLQFWNDRLPPRNVDLYDAIIKCDETPWSSLEWINLLDWVEIENQMLIRKDQDGV